jgi:hypothetical protein
MGAAVIVAYNWTTGVLTCTCQVCRKFIVEIAVRDVPPSEDQRL